MGDVRAPSVPTSGIDPARTSPDSGGSEVAIVAKDGAGGTTPLTTTATAGSGAHVGLDVNVLGSVTISAAGLATSAKQDTANTTLATLALEGGNLASVLARLSPGTHVGSSALEKSHVISAVACTLRSAKVINTGAADAWLHTFDAATLPSNGTHPSRTPILVPAGTTNGDVWQGGTAMATGCVLALSSTVDPLTLIATNDGWFDAETG